MTIAAHVLWRRVGPEVLILDLDSEEYFGLDGAGARYWQLLAGGTPAPAAVIELAAIYDVDVAVLNNDIGSLTAALLERGLVVAVDEELER